MKRIKHMCRRNIVFLLIMGVCCHAWTQEISFSATPSQNRIGVKDAVQVTYKISNVANLKTLGPTNIGDFELIQPPFESILDDNGQVSISRSYVLRPKHEGTLTIPPGVARDAAGHTYQSNAVTIQVVPGSVTPPQQARRHNQDEDDFFAFQQRQAQAFQQMIQQQNQMMAAMMGGAQRQQPRAPVNEAEIKKDVFVKVSVDKTKVRLGEQITATYKLYSRYELRLSGLSRLPSLVGFWAQDFDLQRGQTEEVIDGKRYMVLTIKKSALFPQQTGNLELDPLETTAQVNTINGPLEIKLASTPVKITVTPLPEKNKPADFGGAVGNFSIAAHLDKQEMTTDNIATLKINISGSGNIKLIEAPKPQLPEGISTFDPQIIDTITGRSTTISGSKIITYAITAHTPGDYNIPPLTFSYFNSQSGTYSILHTDSFRLHVKPGKNYSPVAPTAENPVVIKDIHDIATTPVAGLNTATAPLLLTGGYWSAYALPLLAFVGLLVWRRRSDEIERNATRYKSKKANKVALQRLFAAKKLLQQSETKPFYEEISKAIWLYLSDKLVIPLSALSRDAALSALHDRKVPAAIQQSLESVVWDCETALYASGAAKTREQTYEEAIKLISDLEDNIR